MEFLRFVLLGLGIGAIYAMVSQGIVLIYRGSGVVNFAQGAFVMVGGYLYYELRVHANLPGVVAIIGAVVGGAVLGALVQLLILRPMRHSSPIERVIATLGVLITLQAIAVIHYGVSPIFVPSALPTTTLTLVKGLYIGSDRLIILGLGVVMTVALFFVYRATKFGRLASAVAENQRAAASLGHSPGRVAVANWALGSALAALAGALIAPIAYLVPSSLVLLVVPGLAAALVGEFSSFPLAFIGALFIGVMESLATIYITTPGWSDSVPFLVIIVVLIARGTALPLRSFIFDRLPAVGNGKLRPKPTAAVMVVAALLLWFVLQPTWVLAVSVTMVWAIFCLSVVVLTGYAGQLSLAQFVLGGVGAFAAARLMASWHFAFLPAAILGIVITVAFGLVVALPALRTRGINLAIATLGLGIVVFSLILSSYQWAGGDTGITVKSPTLFGWNFSAISFPRRYALVVLVVLLLVALIVTNVRRGITGRRLLAVRSNERAAAALGVNVMITKLYAFALAAALAGVAGILLAFQSTIVIPDQFDVLTSITVIAVTVVGGLGFIGGAIIGATLLPGGIGTQLLLPFNSAQPYLPLATGIFLLYVLRAGNGLYAQNAELVRLIARTVKRGVRRTSRPPVADTVVAPPGDSRAPETVVAPTEPSTTLVTSRERREGGLQIRELSVRFGTTLAVNEVTMDILPREVHGLIGPNGAGKTTVIDALTGFVRPSNGQMLLRGTDIGGWSPRRRARAGIARSFQSLELFSDLTVRENIAVACDSGNRWRYFSDLIWPGPVRLSEVAVLAVRDFHLEEVLDEKPDALDFGQRRLVALARAVASDPDILMLDEPAAGLSDLEAQELATLIRALARDWGMSVLVVEHNIDLVLDLCDRITVLDGGRILASGSPDEVRGNDDVMAAYLGADTAEGVATAGVESPATS